MALTSRYISIHVSTLFKFRNNMTSNFCFSKIILARVWLMISPCKGLWHKLEWSVSKGFHQHQYFKMSWKHWKSVPRTKTAIDHGPNRTQTRLCVSPAAIGPRYDVPSCKRQRLKKTKTYRMPSEFLLRLKNAFKACNNGEISTYIIFMT